MNRLIFIDHKIEFDLNRAAKLNLNARRDRTIQSFANSHSLSTVLIPPEGFLAEPESQENHRLNVILSARGLAFRSKEARLMTGIG